MSREVTSVNSTTYSEQARQVLREGAALDTIGVTDAIEAGLDGGADLVEVAAGGDDGGDPTDLGDELSVGRKPVADRQKVAVHVRFSQPAATQKVTVVLWLWNPETQKHDWLCTETKTATAGVYHKDRRFSADVLEFPARGASHYEVRREPASAGNTEVRAWAF